MLFLVLILFILTTFLRSKDYVYAEFRHPRKRKKSFLGIPYKKREIKLFLVSTVVEMIQAFIGLLSP
jgi:hypothetical protein